MPIFNCGLNDVDTTDATATAAELIVDKTAYVFGDKIIGTMPDNGTFTRTITQLNQVINLPYGYYDGGTIQIPQSEKIKIVPANIKEDVTILGVTGSFSGGAAISLNIEIYNSFPSEVINDTIGIIGNDGTQVNGYVISNSQPENPTSGLVWIKVGNSSPAPISITKEGNAFIYPVAIKQYYNNTWDHTGFEARIYQNGWKALIKYLYNTGDLCGFTWENGTNHLKFESTGIRYNPASAAGRACTNETVDLTDYNTMYVEYSKQNNNPTANVGLNNSHNVAAAVPDVANIALNRTLTRMSINISNVVGPKFLKIYNTANSTYSYTVYKIWLEG